MSGILKTLYTTRPSTWTFNCWVRRTNSKNITGTTRDNSYIVGASDGFTSSNGKGLAFMSTGGVGSPVPSQNEIGFYNQDIGAGSWDQVNSLNNTVCRDFDGWYNIHVQTSSNVANVYVNGIQTHSNLTWNLTNSDTLNIGNLGWVIDGESYTVCGQMQEAHFVDGQSLAYSIFIENSSNYNNALVPKNPTGIVAAVDSTGGYGTNGFYWDFATPQTQGLKFDDLAGKQWRPYPDSVSAAFQTGFVRTGSSARTVNNSSIYFPGGKWGTTDTGLITFEGDIFNPGTKNLTIEGWVYPLQNNSGYLFDTRYSTFTSNPALYWSGSANQLDFYVNSTSVIIHTFSSSQNDGWHHFAATYKESSSQWELFWDGTSLGTAISDWAQQSSRLLLGTRYSLNTVYQNEMFLEGFRYTDKLLYAAQFTAPTSTLTSGSNTKLLTLQDSTLGDDSSSAHTLTATAVTSSTTIVPFNGATSYYFNGTTSRITIPTSTDFEIGSGNYVVEAYIKTTDSVGEILGAFNDTGNFTGFLFGVGFQVAGRLAYYGADSGSTSDTFYSGARVDDGKWHHVAFSKNNTTLQFFIDGVLDSTHTLTATPGSSGQAIAIGSDTNTTPGRYFTGYISNLRVTKGERITNVNSSATYVMSSNGNFTPGPIDSIERYTIDGGSTYKNINGIVHSCLNSNCKDASFNKGSEPKYQLRPFVGSGRQTTGGAGAGTPIYHAGMCGETKYGKSSFYTRACPAITNYGSDWNIGGNIDFTFETWLKWNKTPAGGEGVISIERGDGTYYSYESLLLLSNANGAVALYATTTGDSASAGWDAFSNELFTPTVGQWHHFAYCRSSSDGVVRAYFDGVQYATSTVSLGTFTNPALMLNGRWNTSYTSTGGVAFEGTRLIRGQNIYPGGTTFTPGNTSSTTQYTTNGGTSYSSITGTVPFCLDNQRSTITEDKSSNGKNGGVFLSPVTETGYNQHNAYERQTVAYNDSTKNKFMKLNPTQQGLHDNGVSLGLEQGGLAAYAVSSSGSNNFNKFTGSFGVTSGKYYFECKTYTSAGDNNITSVGFDLIDRWRTGNSQHTTTQGSYGLNIDSYTSGTGGVKAWYNENALTTDIAHTSQQNGGDIFGFAWDVDNQKLYVHQNGNWLLNGDPELGLNPVTSLGSLDPNNPGSNVYNGEVWTYWYSHRDESGLLGNPNRGWTPVVTCTTSSTNTNKSGIIMNFGQGTTGENYSDANGRGKFRYKPPTGFVSMCTLNKEVNEPLGTAAKNPDAYMGVKEYTANGSSQAITGLGFQPDLLIGLQRNDAVGYYTGVMDSVRGNGRVWAPQSVARSHSDLQLSDQISSFDSDGFTVGDNASNGNYLSLSGADYTAYCWKAGGPIGSGADKYKKNGSTFTPEASSMTVNGISCNTDSGFSIMNYTGDTGIFRYNAASGTQMVSSADTLYLGTGDWTVEFWFYTNSLTQSAELVNKGLPFQVYHANGSLTFYASSDGSTYDIAAGENFRTNSQGDARPLGANRWHHVAVVRDKSAGTYSGWLNGRRGFVINSASDIYDSTAEWKFGCYNNSTNLTSLAYQFDGYLADFNVWRGTAQYSDEIIDIVKPSWSNGGTATTLSDFQKSTTNLLMAISFRQPSSLFAVSNISGVNGTFTQTSSGVLFESASRPPGFVAHGLNGRPGFALIKGTANQGSGNLYPICIGHGMTDYIPVLGSTHICINGYADNFYFYGNPSDSNYSLDSQINDENRNYTIYAWQEIPGYSSMGAYWGMPNDNSSTVNLGFSPKFLLIGYLKQGAHSHVWHIFDTTTSTLNNGVYDSVMYPTIAGGSMPAGTNHLHLTSTGFEVIDADAEQYIAGELNGQLFYLAFAEQPFAYANAR